MKKENGKTFVNIESFTKYVQNIRNSYKINTPLLKENLVNNTS